VTRLHLDDLELARECANGDEAAWERFVRDFRPILYRAADALDPSGGARELADGLYGDLYGVEERGGKRKSLFEYFQGRSSLATWLRAVLTQRYIDRVRARRRLAPLPDEDSWASSGLPQAMSTALSPDGDRGRFVEVVREALRRAIARLSDRDRLRLSCYYVQELTLAQIGRVLHEHEATASRHLARTRERIRDEVEDYLRGECGWSPQQIAESLESVAEDPATLDLAEMLGESKKSAQNRSL
jgi:RNA polymerase sigma factor (sigma-70 family)